MTEPASTTDNDFDIVIVGAVISGINAAYRLQTELPGASYTILEARGGIGGTWDFFLYPGFRSDSDLSTFGFPWRPWNGEKMIADGDSIRKYIRDSAATYGIDHHVQYHHKLVSGNWSSDQQVWSLLVDAGGEKKRINGRFVILGTGYYDYKEALPSTITGLESFRGPVVHPQSWPEDLEYKSKKIIVVGSGATAITLIPVLAEQASHVTMVQRSPSYVVTVPAVDSTGPWLHKILPSWLALRIMRIKFLILPFLFFQFCRHFPNAAKRMLKKETIKQLPNDVPHDPHFEPKYNPWEQRLCIAPDGNFFKSLQSRTADIVTGIIKAVHETSIEMELGQSIEADIIVTATGLKILIAGGANFSVDGEPINIPDKFIWRGCMIQDVPNMATIIGYTNASWTLGADATALHLCRLLKYMKSKGLSAAKPHIEESSSVKPVLLLNLNSTYVEKAKGSLPKAGDVAPWRPRTNYCLDLWAAKYGNLVGGLQFSSISR